MDTGTWLGVLGVVLTILFFLVGYRQTIGARKERARSANKLIIDVMFRRLTLEDSFKINREGILKIISGNAIEYRVRFRDIMSVSDIENVLYSKIMESDYVGPEKRIEITNRLADCFKLDEDESSVEGKEKDRLEGVIYLALGSSVAAGAAVVSLASLVSDGNSELLSKGFSRGLTPLVIAIALTAITLAIYTYFRSLTRSTDDVSLEMSSLEAFSRMFSRIAKSINPTLRESKERWCDYFFDGASGVVAIEIKNNINNIIRFKNYVDMLNRKIDSGETDRILIISMIKPSKRIMNYQTDKIKFIAASEFVSAIRSG